MSDTKLLLETEKENLLSMYSNEEIAFYEDAVQESASYIVGEQVVNNIVVKGDGSNG